jgi:hypothetical protein
LPVFKLISWSHHSLTVLDDVDSHTLVANMTGVEPLVSITGVATMPANG